MNDLTKTSQTDLSQNPAAVYLAGLSESSRRPMGSALATIAEMLTGNRDPFSIDWGSVHFQHSQLIRSELNERYKPATVNRHLSALRGVLKSAWRLGQMDAENYHRSVDVKSVKGSTVPKGRNLTADEKAALLGVCTGSDDLLDYRDAAIIALGLAGLRRAEIVSLDLSDFDSVNSEILVKGKGNKERLVPVTNGYRQALLDWLATRGDEPGPIFLPIRKGGHLGAGQLPPQSIYDILQTRGEQAGIKNFSPHDLRRTFVSDMLRAGVDIVTVQRLVGHESPVTTARYDPRGQEERRQAAKLIDIPYNR